MWLTRRVPRPGLTHGKHGSISVGSGAVGTTWSTGRSASANHTPRGLIHPALTTSSAGLLVFVFVFWWLFSHGYSFPSHPSHPNCHRDPQPRTNLLCVNLGGFPASEIFLSCKTTLAPTLFSHPNFRAAGFELAQLTGPGILSSEVETLLLLVPANMLGKTENAFFLALTTVSRW